MFPEINLDADFRSVCKRLSQTWIAEVRYYRKGESVPVRIERRRMQPGWNLAEYLFRQGEHTATMLATVG